ncbi:hypothetical protein IFM89_004999 [Coptis chinensis]|uniref:WW domain-containing protein n=1 Tax=Coptis chinensis TaxID=261450 RepID=A0A835LMA0_9MAGN|nr:hypothetical protein IFM89_004999 [Coptis chinensis]
MLAIPLMVASCCMMSMRSKAHNLGHHSEKLAVAFGLSKVPEGMPIRVMKNLRVCGDWGLMKLEPLKTVGLLCFQDLVYEKVKVNVKDVVICLINREQEGELIDRALLKDVLDVFVEMGMGGMYCYENDFEAALLDDTSTYYCMKGNKWIEEDSCELYILKVEECLRLEKDRVLSYLHSSSEQKIEAADRSTGSVFYYNPNTSKSQWESPLETATGSRSPRYIYDQIGRKLWMKQQFYEEEISLIAIWGKLGDAKLAENLKGLRSQRDYYNTKTHVSQWNKPESVEQNASQRGAMMLSAKSPAESGSKSSISRKCMGCCGWGLDLVQDWGYCNHCIRVLNLPYHQNVAPNLNYQHQIRNTSNMNEDSVQMVPNQRCSVGCLL